jgi:hypothetical protein
LGLTLLLIEKATHDPLYLWDIKDHLASLESHMSELEEETAELRKENEVVLGHDDDH